MDRREFISNAKNSALLLGLSAYLRPALAFATGSNEPYFFVQVFLRFGWDVTLGTDPWLAAKPKDTDMFVEYDPSNVARSGNLAFGPAMLPLIPYANKMTVINGVFMSTSDNGHDAAEKYIKSGSTDQQWGTAAVEIFECRETLPLGILNNNGVLLGSRSALLTNLETIPEVTQISGALGGLPTPSSTDNHLTEVQATLAANADALQSLTQILTQFKNEGENLGDAHYMAASFASGFSQVADFEISNPLDTHSNHPGAHLSAQLKGWTSVADLFRVFQKTPYGTGGQSLFDRTTFMIVSEFSRTPALNPSQGKDHNPMTNSVVLLGPKVRGNNLIGGSRLVTAAESPTSMSYHIGSGIDWKTGQALPSPQGASILRPENVVATVVENLGISRRRFAPLDPQIPSLSHLL